MPSDKKRKPDDEEKPEILEKRKPSEKETEGILKYIEDEFFSKLNRKEFSIPGLLLSLFNKNKEYNEYDKIDFSYIKGAIFDLISKEEKFDLKNDTNLPIQICNDEYKTYYKFDEIFSEYCEEYKNSLIEPFKAKGGFSFKKRSGKKNIFLLFTILLLGVLNITKIIKNFII